MKTIQFNLSDPPQLYNAGYLPLRPDDENIRWFSPCWHRLHWLQCSGSGEISGASVTFEAGDMLLVAAGDEARFRIDEEGFQYLLFFPVSTGATWTMPQQISGGQSHAAGMLILRLWEELNRPQVDAGQAVMTAALTHMLLAECHRLTRPEPGADSKAVVRLGRELATYPETGQDAETLAHRAGLSRNYLARQFRQTFGVSIPEFLRLKRIDRAMLLLEATDMKIAEIGARVGYPEAAHFNKRFRETAGCSPSSFRHGGDATAV